MNELNVATLQASKKLVENGICLETDYFYVNTFSNMGWVFRQKGGFNDEDDFIPAPSMAEVWRELPEEYCKNATDPVRYKVFMSSQVGYHSGGKDGGIWIPYKGNPTDALIDLLVWLKGEGK